MGVPRRQRERPEIIGVSEYEIGCILDNWKTKTDREIGEMLGREAHVVKHYRAAHGLLKAPSKGKASYVLKKPKDAVEGFCKAKQSLISGRWK